MVRIMAYLIASVSPQSVSEKRNRFETDRGNLIRPASTLIELVLMDVPYYLKASSDLPL